MYYCPGKALSQMFMLVMTPGFTNLFSIFFPLCQFLAHLGRNFAAMNGSIRIGHATKWNDEKKGLGKGLFATK